MTFIDDIKGYAPIPDALQHKPSDDELAECEKFALLRFASRITSRFYIEYDSEEPVHNDLVLAYGKTWVLEWLAAHAGQAQTRSTPHGSMSFRQQLNPHFKRAHMHEMLLEDILKVQRVRQVNTRAALE